ncbi:MAG: BspA family leucine-rich repeat surface protein [Lachnospiraceae bacterium]|nr:BspA family leucine-rich repeat surface protein [Lachnospiraceae bacterium]
MKYKAGRILAALMSVVLIAGSIPAPQLKAEEENVISEDKADSFDTVEWTEPAADWYDHWDYSVAGDRLYLTKTHDDLSGNIQLPATANINSIDRIVTLSGNVVLGSGITGLKLKGTKLGDRLNLTGDKLVTADFCEADASELSSMYEFFAKCPELETAIFGNMDTSGVSSMEKCFYYCKKLKNADISKFNTANVTSMNFMFGFCTSLTKLDLKSFNTSKVTDFSWMFADCSALTELDITGFDTSKAEDLSYLFEKCEGLTSIDLSHIDTSAAKKMEGMFYDCKNLTSIDLSKFKTTACENMERMFYGCTTLTSIDVSGFDTSNVTDMGYMFCACEGLKSIDLKNFKTSKVKSLSSIFKGCTSLESMDLSNFDTSSLENMSMMFDMCRKLKSVDLSSFNTSKVKSMAGLFCSCFELENLDVSHFDTSNVESMDVMFDCCKSLTTLDLRNFNTSKCKHMGMMFTSCEKLEYLNVSSFDTSKVEWFYEMFSGLYKIKFLDIRNFNFEGKNEKDELELETENVYLPVKFAGKLNERVKKVFYAGTEQQWKELKVEIPKGTEITYEFSGDAVEGAIDTADLVALDPVPEIDYQTGAIYLVKGQTFTLPDKSWKCLRKDILLVKKGKVKAKKATTEPVEMSREYQGIAVYICDPKLKKSAVLKNGESSTLVLEGLDSHLTPAWYSSDPDVAVVSGNGCVKACGAGKAVISAFVNGKEYKCKLTVNEDVPAKERTLHMTVNDKKKTVKIKGVKKFELSVANNDVVKTDKHKIMPVNPGKADVTVKAEDGSEYLIHVTVEDITLTTDGIVSTGKNKYKLTLSDGTVSQIRFKELERNVAIKSSKPEVAGVRTNGIIKTRKKGKTKITMKVYKKTITINVEVK